jgi:hypothetical protein
MIVSSSVQLGMSWWQAWLCVWIGYGIAAPFIVLNARPGAVHHITFPVVARTSFGLWGSLWVRDDVANVDASLLHSDTGGVQPGNYGSVDLLTVLLTAY